MAEEATYQWVSIEVNELGVTKTFRGRVAGDDLQAIVEGTFESDFFRMIDVHWVQEEKRNRFRAIAYGDQDGFFAKHSGELFMRPSDVISIATLVGPWGESENV